MEEKKLTDEEIVKAFEQCAEHDTCWDCPLRQGRELNTCREIITDLIHRLQREKQTLKSELRKECEEHEEFTQKAKAEIERLTKKVDGYLVLNQTIQTLNEKLIAENAELQKQVDELKSQVRGRDKVIALQVEQCTQKEQQAVKDTAKEILQEIFDEQFEIDVDIDENSKDDVVKVGKAVLTAIHEKIELMADRYGVEVE